MAVFTVTTLTDENDAGATVAVPIGTGLSLREAIAIANATAGADTIVFDASLSGTIRLTDAAGTLQVTEALTIDGDGRILITGDVAGDDAHVSGSTVITDFAASDTAGKVADNVQIFNATADLALNGLTLTGGVTSDTVLFGGAVLGTTVSVTNTTVTGNGAISGGGGIYASTSVTLTNSTVSGNYGATGGGIAATTATLVNSTVSGNSGSMAGGIWASTAVTLTNSTVSGNSADIEVGGVAAPPRSISPTPSCWATTRRAPRRFPAQ
jgi:predicted outer membrane repeat protein